MAAHRSVEEIRQFIEVDTLGYLSLEGLLASVPNEQESYCHACFSARYPTHLPPDITKGCLEDTSSNVRFIDALSRRSRE